MQFYAVLIFFMIFMKFSLYTSSLCIVICDYILGGYVGVHICTYCLRCDRTCDYYCDHQFIQAFRIDR